MRQRRMRISAVAFFAAVATMLVAFVLPGAATSAPPGCANRTNNTYDQLLGCVTLEGVRAHQAALQAIATANGGTRAAGTPGYTESVEYVSGLLEDAGYEVTLSPFQFIFDPADGAAAAHAGQRDLRDRSVHGECRGRRHESGDRRRHQPRATAGEHERLRGGRLRRVPDRATSPSSSAGPARSRTRP